MTYIEAHRARLERRHYVMQAHSPTHFFNLRPNVLNGYRSQYEDDFCLVLDCSPEFDSAYILPYGDVKEYFSEEYLNANRWVGNIRNENIEITLGGKPKLEIMASNYHNAFDLLQEAPKPFPS